MGAFAKAGWPDAQLFAVLARVAEERMGDLNAQNLAGTAWAFGTAGQSDVKLFTALARAAAQRLGDFNDLWLCIILWGLSWLESLRNAWSLFEHAKRLGVALGPLCFPALPMECE